MLMIKATRDAILRPLQTVAGIVERRHTLPILANVLVRKQGEQVSFLATDIEIQVRTAASLGAGKDDAAITVNARKLIDILRSLPDTEVGISLASKKLTIAAGKSRFALQTLGPEEFPTVAASDAVTASLTMPQKQLRHLFAMVHFAMAQQDIRYYLNGLLFVVDGKQARVVATDGHRLAYCASEIDAELGRQEVIIPRKTVTELQRLLADSDEPDRHRPEPDPVPLRRGRAAVEAGRGQVPRLPAGDPAGLQEGDRARPRDLGRRAVARVDPDLREVQGRALHALKVQTTNAEQEEAVEELDVDYSGDALDIGFNVTYLLDVLGNLKTESVRVEFGDANSSALISVPGDDGFKYVVMPMRI